MTITQDHNSSGTAARGRAAGRVRVMFALRSAWAWLAPAILVYGALVSGGGCLLATASGCNMIKEMGEIAGRSPGVHWDMPSLFSQGGFSATSDAKASVKYAKYTAASPDGATGPSLEINDASFGQDVTTPPKGDPGRS